MLSCDHVLGCVCVSCGLCGLSLLCQWRVVSLSPRLDWKVCRYVKGWNYSPTYTECYLPVGVHTVHVRQLNVHIFECMSVSKSRLTSWSRWPLSAWSPGSFGRQQSSPLELSGWWWAFPLRLHFPYDECPPWEMESKTVRKTETKERQENLRLF